MGKEAGRQLQCCEGCVRVCQACPPPPGSVCDLQCVGHRAPGAGKQERRPSPWPLVLWAPSGLQGQSSWGGAQDQGRALRPAACAQPGSLSIEFSRSGRPSMVLLGDAHAAHGRRGVAATASRYRPSWVSANTRCCRSSPRRTEVLAMGLLRLLLLA